MRDSSTSNPLSVNEPAHAPFAGTAGGREEQIESLIVDHAKPTMERIIGRFMYGDSLHGEDADDIVATLDVPSARPGMIVQVRSSGYSFRGRVLRPAQVVTAA